MVTNLKNQDKVKTAVPTKSDVSAASKTQNLIKPEDAQSQVREFFVNLDFFSHFFNV